MQRDAVVWNRVWQQHAVYVVAELWQHLAYG